ncbi:DUF2167 domain-containing protein [Sphingomonas sp. ASY06-1R]|uniref:DUF2167 domain-containing protein n=1 Tax=Sphingomonas sp. ASY06-1R TaxID=3445771 RepID=UPI003FA2D645
MKLSRWGALLAVTISLPGLQAHASGGLSLPALHSSKVDALGWVHGPATVKLGDQAQIRIAKGVRYLGPENTNRFLALNGNQPSADNYTIAPEGSGWFAILTFDPAGYIPEGRAIDPETMYQQIKANEGGDNQNRKTAGEGGLYTDRWLIKPHYQPTSQNLEWATVMHTESGAEIVNYTSRILGRDGVMKAILVSDPAHFRDDLPQYRQAMAGFSYLPGKHYVQRTSDVRMAEYGIGALVAGGAAAIAAKTGLLATLFGGLLTFGTAFYKLFALGAVAVFAGLRSRTRLLLGRFREVEGNDRA